MIEVTAKELDTVAIFSSYSRAYAFKKLLETKGISAKVRAIQ